MDASLSDRGFACGWRLPCSKDSRVRHFALATDLGMLGLHLLTLHALGTLEAVGVSLGAHSAERHTPARPVAKGRSVVQGISPRAQEIAPRGASAAQREHMCGEP
jgi:hypothetical protein